ncbi:MAG: FlgK family flagellar hook-associated protein, partial [Bacillota bacterium]
MRGTFMGIETARRSIQLHRLTMDVANHNIANAYTEGYTRQEAVVTPTTPYAGFIPQARMTYGQVGTGVEASQIRRMRDEYMEEQMRAAGAAQGFWEKQNDYATRLEAVFPEPAASGLQELMVRFFNNWQSLNNTPQDPGIKAAVWETAEEMAVHFNEMYIHTSDIYQSLLGVAPLSTAAGVQTGVTDNQGGQTGQTEQTATQLVKGALVDAADQVNQLVEQIVALNKTIKSVVEMGNQPNDLYDRRDALLRQLASFGAVRVENVLDSRGNISGLINIKFYKQDLLTYSDPSAQPTVNKVSVALDRQTDQSGQTVERLLLAVGEGGQVDLSEAAQNVATDSDLLGGFTGLEAARRHIKTTLDSLDKLAKALIDGVNAKLSTLDKPFTFFSGSGARDMKVVTGADAIDGEKA